MRIRPSFFFLMSAAQAAEAGIIVLVLWVLVGLPFYILSLPFRALGAISAGGKTRLNFYLFQILSETEVLGRTPGGKIVHVSGVNTAPLIDGDAYNIMAYPNGAHRYRARDGGIHQVASFSATKPK